MVRPLLIQRNTQLFCPQNSGGGTERYLGKGHPPLTVFPFCTFPDLFPAISKLICLITHSFSPVSLLHLTGYPQTSFCFFFWKLPNFISLMGNLHFVNHNEKMIWVSVLEEKLLTWIKNVSIAASCLKKTLSGTNISLMKRKHRKDCKTFLCLYSFIKKLNYLHTMGRWKFGRWNGRQKALSLWENKYFKMQWVQIIAFVFNRLCSTKIK